VGRATDREPDADGAGGAAGHPGAGGIRAGDGGGPGAAGGAAEAAGGGGRRPRHQADPRGRCAVVDPPFPAACRAEPTPERVDAFFCCALGPVADHPSATTESCIASPRRDGAAPEGGGGRDGGEGGRAAGHGAEGEACPAPFRIPPPPAVMCFLASDFFFAASLLGLLGFAASRKRN